MEIRITANSERSIEYFITRRAPICFGSRESLENLDRSKAVQRFKRVWSQGLEQAVMQVETGSLEDAKKLLRPSETEWLKSSMEQRSVRYQNEWVFVVQLKLIQPQIYELDQIWFAESRNTDPRLLCIKFETERGREEFDKLAKREKGKDGRDLIWEWIQDFINQHHEK